jgi:hypothetical protein
MKVEVITAAAMAQGLDLGVQWAGSTIGGVTASLTETACGESRRAKAKAKADS